MKLQNLATFKTTRLYGIYMRAIREGRYSAAQDVAQYLWRIGEIGTSCYEVLLHYARAKECVSEHIYDSINEYYYRVIGVR